MRVSTLSRAANPGSGAVRLVATFDVEIDHNLRIFALKLMETPEGRRIIWMRLTEMAVDASP